MKTTIRVLLLSSLITIAFCMQSYSADKVVVIPLNSKVKTQTCTPQYENVARYLSIPGAAFLFALEDSATYAKRQTLGGAAEGVFAHNDNVTSHTIVAPVNFPANAISLTDFGFAICGNSSTSGSTVKAELIERSMINGTSSLIFSYTIDNASGDKGCHVLYGSTLPISYLINTEINVYYLSIYGLDGGGEFDLKRTELDYVRIGYSAKEIKQFTCQ